MKLPSVLLDVDGTLIDANYQHALAWYRAFRKHEIVLPLWRIHRHVGMGGDQIVAALAGGEVEEKLGDDLRDKWEQVYEREFIDEVVPLPGAQELIRELKTRGHMVVLASSSPQDHIERYLDLLGAKDVVDAWTTNDDVEATKPAPDLVHAALDKADGSEAIFVGDTRWDIEAAKKVGLETICVLTGGWSEHELREAGAVAVFENAGELSRRLAETPLNRG